jgi:WD40 repeat protein
MAMTVSRFLFLLANFWITTSICVLVLAARRHAETVPPLFADWKLRGEEKHFSPGIVELLYSPDGTKLASVNCFVHSFDMRVSYARIPSSYLRILQSTSTGWELRSMIEMDDLSFYEICFSRDSRRVEFGGGEWKGEKGLVSWDIERQSMDLQPGGRSSFLAAGLYAVDGENGHTVDVLRMDDDGLVAHIEYPDAKISSGIISSDGRYLLLKAQAADNTSKIILWNVGENRQQCEIAANANDWHAQNISADGMFCSASTGETTIGIFETATGKMIRNVDAKSDNLWCVAFSPDGRLFAAGFERAPKSDVVAIVWDIATGEIVNTIHDRESWVTAIVFSPDSQTLATGDSGGTIRFWSPATPQELAEEQEEQAEIIREVTLSEPRTK